MGNNTKNILVSVIIPTYNGAQSLRELFAVLCYQTLKPMEILVVDSSSNDETAAVCRQHGAEVEVIKQQDFDHGGTRSMVARRARGEILVFFTQDALPATRDCLEKLVAQFNDNPLLAASYGRQLPTKHASFAAAHLREFNYPARSELRSYEDRSKYGIATIFCSNSFAAYRKKALEQVDYFKNGLIFGEDTCTVGRLLQAGFQLAYCSDAKVYHSHNYSLMEEFRRSFDIGVLHTTESSLFADFGSAEKRGQKYVLSGIRELRQKKQYSVLIEFLCRMVMKFLGYRCGKHYLKLPTALAARLSMHSGWWQSDTMRNTG